MKRYLPFLIVFVLPSLAFSQFEMRYGYQFNSPQNFMRSSLNDAHGFSMDWYGSVKKTNYYTGFSLNLASYGYHTEPIDFITSDGDLIKTNLNINNNFHTWSIYHRYRFSKFEENGSRIVPFIEGRTGWSFFRTSLVIADPEDTDGCAPLEKDILQKDNTWNLYGGAGFDFLLTGICHPEKISENGPKSYFSFSFGYNYGGKVSYMNVDKGGENTSSHHNHGTTSESGDQKPYYTNWINTQTQVVHQHHTGFIYTSPIRMLELKAGFTFRF